MDPDVTDEFERWYNSLTDSDRDKVNAAVERLEQDGPALGRPLVDTLSQSRHPNMKELIPPGSQIRILFAFDPRRIPVLLIGGDKTGLWNRWYQITIPIADNLFDRHLARLRKGP